MAIVPISPRLVQYHPPQPIHYPIIGYYPPWPMHYPIYEYPTLYPSTYSAYSAPRSMDRAGYYSIYNPGSFWIWGPNQ